MASDLMVWKYVLTKLNLSVNVPSSQIAKAGSFAEEHNISVSKTSIDLSSNTQNPNREVNFKNVCSLLKFTLPELENWPDEIKSDEIRSVTFTSGTDIAGSMTVNFVGDEPTMTGISGSKSVTMEGEFKPGKTYCFVVAPVELDGISIVVETSSGKVYIKSKLGKTKLTQGTYRSLGTLNFDKMRPITVSSEHTYGESNGESKKLTGTKLNMSLPEDLTDVSLSVKNSDGNEVRKIDDLSRYSNGVIINTKTKDTDWPYLPKGDYTVSGS